MSHRTTDPACLRYRRPTSRLALWWHNRNRLRICLPCARDRWANAGAVYVR